MKKQVPGFSAYAVSRDGTVWTRWTRGGRKKMIGRTWRVKQTDADEKNHLHVQLFAHGRKSVRRPVHQLVLEAFVGPRPLGMESLHRDGNPRNNAARNLRWGTRKENWEDRRRHGRACDGEENSSSKLTIRAVGTIRKERSKGVTLRVLAVRFGVSMATVSNVALRKSWRSVRG